jgi:ubiquitin-like protein Pup
MTQKQTSGPSRRDEDDESAGTPAAQTTETTSTDDIDDLLDDIDEVLEGHTEAEAALFVNQYVQKGGQ